MKGKKDTKLKRIASLLLALVMVFGLGTTAFAAMEGELPGGSITITNPAEGQTYNAYQILYIESYDAEAKAYAYKANSAWADWLATQTAYVTIDDQGYVTWVDGADEVAFAKLAAAQLAGKTADGTATAAEGGTAVTISGLKLGYYLVNTTLGTLCALDTTNPAVNVTEKNEAPESTKEVKEDSNNAWGAENDADINQKVEYQSTIEVKDGAVNYKFRDTMTDGLTFNNDVVVKIGDTEVEDSNYTLTVPDGEYTFTIAFDNEWIAEQVGETITITYSATLNENAVAGEAETNTADLEYGNKPEDERDTTPDDETKTYTWEFKVFKYTGDNTPLAGAEFKLYKLVGNDKTYAIVDDNGELTGWTTTEGEASTLTSGEDGYINISGLDADTYYLTETKAPAGYNELAEDVTVIIDSDGNVKETADGAPLADKTVKVLNNTGAELPSTGGMGTTIFYVLGGILVLGAAVLLITRKRMSAQA